MELAADFQIGNSGGGGQGSVSTYQMLIAMGEDGDEGPPGPPSITPGAPGSAGIQGLAGLPIFLPAEDGEEGQASCVPGLQGIPGVPGIPGTTGPPIFLVGEDGQDGEPGIRQSPVVVTATAPLTIDGAAAADLSANRTLAMAKATAAVDGYLASGDFAIFSGKQSVPTGVNVPYAAGDYTGYGSMTWTVDLGDMLTNRYMLIGKLLIWTVYISTSTVGGTLNLYLLVNIPNSMRPKGAFAGAAYVIQAGATKVAAVSGGNAYANLFVELVPSANFAASTNATDVAFVAIFEIA